MKTKKPKNIGISLSQADIERLVAGLHVLCQDLEFYQRRTKDEGEIFKLVAEYLNCKELQDRLAAKLSKEISE